MFHVVRVSWRSQLRGWEIYLDNKPFIRLRDRLELSRMEARALVRDWNAP